MGSPTVVVHPLVCAHTCCFVVFTTSLSSTTTGKNLIVDAFLLAKMALTKRGADMITIVSALVALATLSVALRFAARMKLRLNFQIDDWLCLVALVALLGMLVELILCKSDFSLVSYSAVHAENVG